MSIGKKFTYWQFIKKNGVIIPLIQRDYAQGREGKAELRKHFLENIKEALLNKTAAKPLILDFVYGVDDNKNIIPLDGQQRLTTLWLLHWYIYIKSKRNIKQDNLNYFQKFTYQTRISSRKFCEELVNLDHFKQLRKLAEKECIKECIIKQTWFMSEWEQDPTVKSMLNMLGGKDQSIESIFKGCDFNYLWEKLTNDKVIVFYYLPIDGEIIQDPDDIYIKMNARGEHLTDFENFKADLIKHIGEQSENWKVSLGDTSGLALSKLIDNDWTDVFWTDLSKENNKNAQKQSKNNDIAMPGIDRQFFAFLNRYFLNQILVKSQKSADALNKKDTTEKDSQLFQYLYGKEGKADINLTYKDFQMYQDGGVITVDTFKALKTIFDVLRTEIVDIQPAWNKDEKFHFLPYLIKPEKGLSESEERLKDISQIHRVVFFGICCYLEKCNDKKTFSRDYYSFKEWMRFVWNIAYNSDVQTIDNMQKAILKINDVRNGTHDIINTLKTQSLDDKDSYLSRQWNEEIEKAKLYDQRERQIKKAEALFHGSIRFLIKDLLEEQYINKAKNELFLADTDQWIFNILPFFPNANQDQKISVTFYESKRDAIEIINRDKHIIKAVQSYLTQRQSSLQSQTNIEPWIKTLLNIRNGDSSLFDYSISKKVQSYFGSNDIPKCVYLYNRSNWKKDECILLSSYSENIQKNIEKRNGFILDKLKKEGYELLIDDNVYKNVSYPDEKAYEGRAIVITNGSDIIFCWASGYRQGDNDILKYPNIIEKVT